MGTFCNDAMGWEFLGMGFRLGIPWNGAVA